MAQTHSLQPLRRLLPRGLDRQAADQQRHGNVFQGAEIGQQMMELVDEPQRAIAYAAAFSVRHMTERPAFNPHLAAAQAIQAA
ncbi:dihydroxyacetone kinase [Lasius niger]|uniref:Dihydroxyacetone kinase n=1 Tax=Lasius niger TaxID=67767 RepID=A0A0J7MLU0_LASNI|nr:dihydroxyacetone kinase [Lasius niger]